MVLWDAGQYNWSKPVLVGIPVQVGSHSPDIKMPIKEFKAGDIITRIARCKVMSGDKFLHYDGSYAGNRLEFIGFEKGIIMFFDTTKPYFDEPFKLDGWDGWDDNNWDYFPDKLWQTGIARMKKFFAKAD